MRFAIIALLTPLLALAAHSEDTPSLAGRTLKLTSARGGAETIYRFAEGGAYESADARGLYALENGRLCLTPESGATFCMPFEGEHPPGESWPMKGPNGATAFTAEMIE